MARPTTDHIIICGLGHVGYRCFTLLRDLGEHVAVIASGASAEWCREVEEAGMTCLVGDASDDRLLVEAGIRNARAIIAATDRDIVNLSIAMDARRLNPRCHVVVRLFDQRLAPHVERALGIRRAVSTSALAAPIFAAAALGGEEVCRFSDGTRTFLLTETTTDSPAEHGFLALYHAVGGGLRRCAGGESDSEPGGTVLQVSEEPGRGERPRPERENRRAGTLRRWLRGVADSVPRPIRIALIALALVAAVSVLIFQRTMNLSPIDALYFLIATLTTTGFGDISFARAPWQLKLYGCVLMLCGGLLMAVVVSVMTDVLVSLRLRDVLAVRRLPPAPHIILAGLGSVGYRIARELCESGESVVVVAGDTDDEYAPALCGSVMIVVGDPSREESLRKAGLEQAKTVVAITENDVTNLGIALTARTINPAVRTVIRVFDAALAEKLQTDLAIDRVMSVSAVSAPTLVAVALHADARNAVVWREHLLTVFLERATDGRRTDGSAQTGRDHLEVRLCEVRVGDSTRLEILPEEGPTADGSRVMRIGCARLRSPG